MLIQIKSKLCLRKDYIETHISKSFLDDYYQKVPTLYNQKNEVDFSSLAKVNDFYALYKEFLPKRFRCFQN